MKKTFRSLALLMAVMMIMTMGLAACGSKTDKAAEDGQNPAMNFIGDYVCDRADIFIGAEGEDGMNATVTWGSSASEHSAWTMSGTFDPETLQFEYHDCIRTDYVYDEDGEVKSQEDVYTGGHGFMTFTEGDPITLTWQDDQENMAKDMTFEYTGMIPEGGETGLANPWSDVDSIEEAVEGAGLDFFELPTDSEISLGTLDNVSYRFMADLAEATFEFPAVQMTIRKGSANAAIDGDISGDYNEYEYEWTQNIKGLDVTCYGNREGEATKTIWEDQDGYCYSICVTGLGGDEDFGLSADDLDSLINGIQ